MKWILFGVLELCFHSALAQVESGTIIVFHITQTKFIIGADSRAILNGVPEDTNCKISAFQHQIVFATSGGSGYRSSKDDPMRAFSSVSEARRAARSALHLGLDKIADRWANNMARNFTDLNRFHPELVLEVAKKGNGVLANGLFAMAKDGAVDLAARSVTFSPFGIGTETIRQDCRATICATGKTEVFSEYTSSPALSDRARREGILSQPSNETARIRRLVQLSILYSNSNDVGGAIDIVELWNDGSVHWVSRKRNCPENEN